MILNDIVTFVTSKINMIDAVSQNDCLNFVNRRYQMIYDTRDWVDLMISQKIQTVAGTGVYTVPTILDRITVLRAASDLVEPVDYPFILDAEPDLRTATGAPKYYIEYTDPTTSARKFQIYPTPDDAYDLDVYGKLKFTPLTGTDSPQIRNIDNCLIAFTYFDMLQRARQFDKAQVVLQEATTALSAVQELETQRANRPRTTKKITARGDTLSEMSDAVAARIRDYTVETRIMIQEFLRRNYLELYDSQLWPESVNYVQVPRDGSEVILPEYADRVISVRQNVNLAGLAPVEQSLYMGLAPQLFEQSGSPVAFSVLRSVGVAVLPPTNEPLLITSDSDSDISNVYVIGETGGVEVEETVQLNGKVGGRTSYTYDTPITISKGQTVGKLTVTGFESQTFLVELLPSEYERKHVRLWLQPTPTDNDGQNCLALVKLRIKPLTTDESTPVMRGIGTALINLATADMMDMLGNANGATGARTKAQASLDTIKSRELSQTAYAPRILPQGMGFGDSYSLSGFGSSWGKGYL